MDKRNYDRDMVEKMYDIIELIYILNRLTNEFYEEDYSKQYLLDIMDDVQNIKYSCNKYRGKDIDDIGYRAKRHGCYSCGRKDSYLDKIIFFLKSLNER